MVITGASTHVWAARGAQKPCAPGSLPGKGKELLPRPRLCPTLCPVLWLGHPIEFPADLVKRVFSSSFHRWGIWSSKGFRNLLLVTQQKWDTNQVCLQTNALLDVSAYIRLFLYTLYGTNSGHGVLLANDNFKHGFSLHNYNCFCSRKRKTDIFPYLNPNWVRRWVRFEWHGGDHLTPMPWKHLSACYLCASNAPWRSQPLHGVGREGEEATVCRRRVDSSFSGGCF